MTRSKDLRAFVKAWNSARCLSEVARKFGLTNRQATSRAHALRKRGVPLKRFTSAGDRVDYEELRRLADSG